MTCSSCSHRVKLEKTMPIGFVCVFVCGNKISMEFGFQIKIRVRIQHLPLTSPALSALGPGNSEPVFVILLDILKKKNF